jgi:hypothetical protein
MCCLAHGGHSQCKGADTKHGDAMGIVVERAWCLYCDKLCLYCDKLCMCLLTSCICI